MEQIVDRIMKNMLRTTEERAQQVVSSSACIISLCVRWFAWSIGVYISVLHVYRPHAPLRPFQDLAIDVCVFPHALVRPLQDFASNQYKRVFQLRKSAA